MPDTERLKLPLLAVAQAQKEMTHNEALTLLDAAVQATVVSVAPATVPATPVPGQCWIVGVAATGAWAGHDGALATWTAGGWRFVAPFLGMAVWSLADNAPVRRMSFGWYPGAVIGHWLEINGAQVVSGRRPAIADPSGGTTVDAEARATLVTILGALRGHGLIYA